MNLPGFTAEASLYEESDEYMAKSNGSENGYHGEVVPQRIALCRCIHIGGKTYCELCHDTG
jgi:CDGSH-type Zn-finger protein